MQSVQETITLLNELGQTDINFSTAVEVKPTEDFTLMQIWGVSVDANNRLWVRSNRKDEIEITNNLLYSKYILNALNLKLCKAQHIS